MQRAIVLVVCLGSAAGIASYTYYAERDTGEPVYSVPAASPAPPTAPKADSQRRIIAADDTAALARELQRELKRVGCYSGEVSGVWTAASRLAMKTFVEHVNAALPVDKPDPVLLSLVQGRQERVCGTAAVIGAGAAGAAAAGMALGAAKDAKAPTRASPESPSAADPPPEPKPAKRPRKTSKPPKIVSDFLKMLGK